VPDHQRRAGQQGRIIEERLGPGCDDDLGLDSGQLCAVATTPERERIRFEFDRGPTFVWPEVHLDQALVDQEHRRIRATCEEDLGRSPRADQRRGDSSVPGDVDEGVGKPSCLCFTRRVQGFIRA